MPSVPRPQLVSYAVVAVAILVLGGRWLAARGDGEPATAAAPAAAAKDPAPVKVEERAPPRVLVHVAGAVRRPGVYRLPGDARVRDAVERAGGARDGGDPNAINLAAVLQDGAQVVVPRRAPAAAGAAASAAGAGAPPPEAPAAPVNLNTASAEELQTLDGVGPATAAAILEYRTQQGGFRTVDDLDQVPGIGPKTMAALRDSVTV